MHSVDAASSCVVVAAAAAVDVVVASSCVVVVVVFGCGSEVKIWLCLKRVGSENALNHWANIGCSPYGSEAAWRCVQLRPMLTLLRGTGSRRAQCLDTPPA